MEPKPNIKIKKTKIPKISNFGDLEIEQPKQKLIELDTAIWTKINSSHYTHKKIDGLYYIENIIDNPSELFELVNKSGWVSISAHPASRQVQHWGYTYDYKSRKINKLDLAVPDHIDNLSKKLQELALQLKLIPPTYTFNQCIINNYNPGQGISPHIDLLGFSGVIGCFTICSGATMRFANLTDGETHEIYIKPNSLYIMSGDSRYKWTHEMLHSKYDIIDSNKILRDRRISLTSRNVP